MQFSAASAASRDRNASTERIYGERRKNIFGMLLTALTVEALAKIFGMLLTALTVEALATCFESFFLCTIDVPAR